MDTATEQRRKRITQPNAVLVTPMVGYVRPEVFEAISGYTVKAIERKRESGVWTEGNEWVRAPDGNILISIEGYNSWARSGSK